MMDDVIDEAPLKPVSADTIQSRGLARLEAQNVTGSQATTVTTYDPVVKTRAYELFLMSDYTAAEIATTLDVRVEVIRAWSNKEKWMVKKQELERELILQAESKARKFILANQPDAREQQYRIGRQIESIIEDVIKSVAWISEDGKPDMKIVGKLKQLTEALTNASAIVARSTGMTDQFANNMVAQIKEMAERSSGMGARPLNIIINQAQQPQSADEMPPITVTPVSISSALGR